MLLLHVAGDLGGGRLLPREALGRLELEAEQLRVLAPESPHVGIRRGQQAPHDLAEERLLRVDGAGACPLAGRAGLRRSRCPAVARIEPPSPWTPMRVRTRAASTSTYRRQGFASVGGEGETSARLRIWSDAERNGWARPASHRQCVEELGVDAIELELRPVSRRELHLVQRVATGSVVLLLVPVHGIALAVESWPDLAMAESGFGRKRRRRGKRNRRVDRQK